MEDTPDAHKSAAPAGQTRARLGVVMPAYNEGAWVLRAVDALLRAAERAGWAPVIVIVDDGSTDDESRDAFDEVAKRPGVRVLHQRNSGRFAARAAGLREIDADYILLLDARVEVEPDSLLRIRRAVEEGAEVWNYDVTPASRDLRALFWTGITKVWWRDYFRDRRPVAFGPDDFDRYPKGTGAFLAPAPLLRDAALGFESHFADESLASDDTRLLRAVAEVQDINLSPDVMCRHHAKTGAGSWTRQCFYRGTTFVDGYLSDRSKARGLLGAVSLAAGIGAVVAVTAPRTAATGVVLGCLATGSAARCCGGSARESVAVGVLSPAFGVLFGAGVVRGLRLAAGRRD